MKKLFIVSLYLALFVLSLTMFSCSDNNKCIVENKSSTPVKKEAEVVDNYSSPALMNGSDFGRIFQMNYKLGNFDEMLNMTSDSSINAHGRDNVLKYYQEMEFAFDIKLKSMKEIGNSTYILNYNSYKIATKKMFRMRVVCEGGVFKVVLPDNLNDFVKGKKVFK